MARYVDHGGHLDSETGVMLARLADRLCDQWPEPDAGLWELGDDRRYTSSLIDGRIPGSCGATRRSAPPIWRVIGVITAYAAALGGGVGGEGG